MMPRDVEPPADSKATVSGRRGRPRMYKDAAEKQRAHRLRVKQQLVQLKSMQSIVAGNAPDPSTPQDKPRTGREMLQALKANGFVGAWKDRDDIGDSVEFARELRRRVWSREDPRSE
jgi:hypothetical protein